MPRPPRAERPPDGWSWEKPHPKVQRRAREAQDGRGRRLYMEVVDDWPGEVGGLWALLKGRLALEYGIGDAEAGLMAATRIRMGREELPEIVLEAGREYPPHVEGLPSAITYRTVTHEV